MTKIHFIGFKGEFQKVFMTYLVTYAPKTNVSATCLPQLICMMLLKSRHPSDGLTECLQKPNFMMHYVHARRINSGCMAPRQVASLVRELWYCEVQEIASLLCRSGGRL